jgi:Rad3-related DNA helicase
MSIELPSWCEQLYPYQVTALQEILNVYKSGHNVAVVDAPTGAGKTLIGDLVRQSLGVRTLYLCSSISLQEQFLKDFPQAALVKGRSNYPTFDNPDSFPKLNASDCDKSRVQQLPDCLYCDPSYVAYDTMHCRQCHPVKSCPYESAKSIALKSDLVCTNTSYFLYESNYVGTLPLARQLIIVDEADLLEDTLLSFVEVHISKRQARDLSIEAPTKKTVESAWIEWSEYAETHLKGIRSSSRFHGTSLESIRARKSLDSLIRNIRRLNHPERGLRAGGWIYTGYDKGDISFKPIQVDHIAKEYLWKHSPRWLLMSATTISFSVMMESLGL